MAAQIIACDKALGSTFADELAAAGWLGEHFSWTVPGEDGSAAQIEFFDDTPSKVSAGVMAVYAKHIAIA